MVPLLPAHTQWKWMTIWVNCGSFTRSPLTLTLKTRPMGFALESHSPIQNPSPNPLPHIKTRLLALPPTCTEQSRKYEKPEFPTLVCSGFLPGGWAWRECVGGPRPPTYCFPSTDSIWKWGFHSPSSVLCLQASQEGVFSQHSSVGQVSVSTVRQAWVWFPAPVLTS